MFYKSHLKSEFNFSNKLFRAFWHLIYLLFFRFSIVQLNPLRRLLLRLFGASVGKKVLIYPSAQIWAPWNLSLGDRSVIGPNVILYNVDRIEIAEDVTISQNVHLCTASHNIESIERELIHSPIIIERGSWVFADAFVAMGVKVGEGSIVGARSVVTKCIESQCVVAGNPAKVLKKRKVDWLIDES